MTNSAKENLLELHLKSIKNMYDFRQLGYEFDTTVGIEDGKIKISVCGREHSYSAKKKIVITFSYIGITIDFNMSYTNLHPARTTGKSNKNHDDYFLLKSITECNLMLFMHQGTLKEIFDLLE